MTTDRQRALALRDLNNITDLSKSEGTFMEFMAQHECTIRAALAPLPEIEGLAEAIEYWEKNMARIGKGKKILEAAKRELERSRK